MPLTAKRTYDVSGLSCASCAAKIEHEISKIEGVEAAVIDLSRGRLYITPTEDADWDAVLRDAGGIADRIEPGTRFEERSGAKAAPSRTLAHADGDACGCGGVHGDCASGDESKSHETAHTHDGHDHGSDDKPWVLWARVGGAIALLLLGMLLPIPETGTFLLHLFGWLLIGYDILLRTVKNISKGNIFDENFLMTLATIGALFIGETAEAVGVMVFYQIGEWFQHRAVEKSRKNIADMMDLQPETANLLEGEQVRAVPTESVAPGSLLFVRPGERVPLDGVLVSGGTSFDTAALTGESMPKDAAEGDEVLGGFINLRSAVTVKTTKAASDTAAARITSLLEEASANKAPTEAFITRFSRVYTPVVVLLAALISVIPPLFFGGVFSDWLYRGLVFLVVSCPCALVLSVPLGYFGGIGGASRLGVMVKGGNYLEALARATTVVFDKTGTLTEGRFAVTEIRPAEGVSKEELLALAARAEAGSSHPIAKSIIEIGGEYPPIDTTEYPGRGVSADIDGRTIYVGNPKLMAECGVSDLPDDLPGTGVFLAEKGRYLGCLLIEDTVRPEAKEAIADLKSLGVRDIRMFTGDTEAPARKAASALGIDRVSASLLPQDKLTEMETLIGGRGEKERVLFVGDGINDAPVLKRADIGVAMASANNQIAAEASDIVILSKSLLKVPDAMRVAKKTQRVVTENVVFALGVKAVVLVASAFGYAPMWLAVFADVGVALLAVLNSLRPLSVKK